MKKFLQFFEMVAYILGAIGGFGYALYSRAYLIAICIVVLAWMAWPEFRKCWPSKE